ncbi:glycosyltransferase family 4 protein [candidate division WOR-3 bacterium]|nr:glycosyltransferase family 4 protein [candidate division WOR-3 bacterium]
MSARAFFRGRLAYLREQGYEVHLASSPGEDLLEVGQREGIAIHPLPMRRPIAIFADFVSLFRACLLIRRLSPDIVDAGTAKAGLLFGLAAALNGVPCRVHSLLGLFETKGGGLGRLLRLTQRISCSCAHLVICISPSLRRRAIELDMAGPDKIRCIGHGSVNGVDAERFAPTEATPAEAFELRDRLGIEHDAPVVGFVGRLVRDKGIPELVDAFLKLRELHLDVRLLLVGAFEDVDPVPDLTMQAIRGTPGITAVGFAPNPVPYYHVMDVLAFPTHREGFGEVALEAAAAGKPVVTTNATGAVDGVVDGVTGIVVPVGDADALADALRRILDDPEAAKRMGAAGQRRARTEFRPITIWEGIDVEYRRLLTDSRMREN